MKTANFKLVVTVVSTALVSLFFGLAYYFFFVWDGLMIAY